MIEHHGGKVRIEIVPWLTQPFGQRGSSRLILEEEIDHELPMVDFLSSLANKYPAVVTAILDLDAGQLFDHVNIVHNDTMIGSGMALEQPIRGGDSLVFLPAYVGG